MWDATKQDVYVCDSNPAVYQPERVGWLRFHRSVWLATAAKSLYAVSRCCLLEFKPPFPPVLPTKVTCTAEVLNVGAVLIIKAKDCYCHAASRVAYCPGCSTSSEPAAAGQTSQGPIITKIPNLILPIQIFFPFRDSGSPCMLSFCLCQEREELCPL